MDAGTSLQPVPGKVQAIGIFHLVGGILNVLAVLAWGLNGLAMGIGTFGIGCVLCAPALVLIPICVFEFMSAAKHLSKDHTGLEAPKLVGIAEVASILACNVIPTVFGILTLVFLSDPEVSDWYERNRLPGP